MCRCTAFPAAPISSERRKRRVTGRSPLRPSVLPETMSAALHEEPVALGTPASLAGEGLCFFLVCLACLVYFVLACVGWFCSSLFWFVMVCFDLVRFVLVWLVWGVFVLVCLLIVGSKSGLSDGLYGVINISDTLSFVGLQNGRLFSVSLKLFV